MRVRFFAAVALLAACSGLQAQTIFKCRDAKGQISFQHQPCDGNLRGKVEVQPANVVEGRPAGDQQLRVDAERRRQARAGLERGEIVPGMTEDEIRQTLDRRYDGIAAKPCYSALEIRNAEVGIDSFKSTPYERRAKRREIERMRNCVR